MRQPRIKLAAERGPAAYHCMSRTVNGERLFGDVERETFRRQMRQVADFCGIKILTYALLSNHFHVLALVPEAAPVSDEELLRRYSVLYPKPTKYQTARLEVIRAQLATDGPLAVTWRKKQLALMGDVSQFMKLLKQRFTRWFNRSHSRYGTLWAERFKSVLVEPLRPALLTISAYIDLNAVRAGMVIDPADYRFCGYAEAVGGGIEAQTGLLIATAQTDWTEAQADYRQLLFGTGAGGREYGQRIDADAFAKVLREGGRLPLATLLRCRVRYFTDGAILGSRAFVQGQLADYRARSGRVHAKARELPDITDWRGLTTLRTPRLG
jgi:putative transposase